MPRYIPLRERVRRFLQSAGALITTLAGYVVVRLVVEWLLTWVGALVAVCGIGLALVVYVVQLMNPSLPVPGRMMVQSFSSQMAAVISPDIADLPDGRAVSRGGAPQRDPTGGPNYQRITFAILPEGLVQRQLL